MIDFLLLVVLFFAVYIGGIASALYTLQKDAPDLYEEYKRRREAKEGKR